MGSDAGMFTLLQESKNLLVLFNKIKRNQTHQSAPDSQLRFQWVLWVPLTFQNRDPAVDFTQSSNINDSKRAFI
ncbi:hypothetical protein Q7C36_002808 [Tachysurus vachellii]|uniref:Uncharacterized protein n=1 Tax=Tachysurus vachellii TaxID=175792 RepID=A0AA88NTK5_TACVA|nr:hypothetical protein Q7C36_002808 [Tachysurus vachellii]